MEIAFSTSAISANKSSKEAKANEHTHSFSYVELATLLQLLRLILERRLISLPLLISDIRLTSLTLLISESMLMSLPLLLSDTKLLSLIGTSDMLLMLLSRLASLKPFSMMIGGVGEGSA